MLKSFDQKVSVQDWEVLLSQRGSSSAGRETAPNPLSITHAERGKPVFPPSGRQIARNAVGNAGKGGRKKRTPASNRPDRGSNFALTRKRADFLRVSNHERTYQSN